MKQSLSICLVLLGTFISCQSSKKDPGGISATLTKLWESDTTLITPESVLFNQSDGLLYVTCIGGVPPNKKDGDGYIAKISAKDGSIIESQWVTSLNAPKGMGISGDFLFVADIDEIIKIDLVTGEILAKYPVEGADFLNDIDVSPSGEVFISDSGTDKVHLISGDSVITILENEEFDRPNGLLHLGDTMMMATSGSGNFYTINTQDWTYSVLTDSIFGGDGVRKVGDDFLVSSWNGEIYYVTSSGKKKLLIDTKGIFNTADFEFLPESNTVLVPTFFGNQVIAYKLDQ